MMQLGFVTAIVPDYTMEQVFQLAHELGYDCIEVMCWPIGQAERRYAGVTHIDVLNLTDSEISRILALMTKYQVHISALGYYPNPLSPNAAESQKATEHIAAVMQGAAKLGIGQMNTFIGRDWQKSVADNWPRFLGIWPPLIDLADTLGVKVGIENCPMFFTQDEWPGGKNLAISPKVWREMFLALPSLNFGLNYDPSHMVWQRMDYLAPLREFRNRLHHIHAKDVRVDTHRLNDVGILAHPLEYHSPKLPGLGDVNWGAFFSVLGDVGYTGSVCVEVEDRAYEATIADRIASLQQSHNYLRNYIPKKIQQSRRGFA